MIRRLLVANRGEIARRVFRTCRELGIGTVAVHSDADAGLPFVREADVAVRLKGSAPAETYLRADLVVAAAQRAGADAVHPGYGFLSESPELARQVVAAGLTWVGPTPEAMEQMASKVAAKKLMADAGVPVLAQLDQAAVAQDDLPLLVKASAGGGGRGMRVVRTVDEVGNVVDQASAEAASAFGDPTVFCEPYVERGRHVEVQILGDTHGTVLVLGDRDCSVQRRHQKVVEEAPAPGLPDAVRAAMHDAARAAGEAIGYVGAGTVEFLYHEASQRFFFLEMNTRLQVEHPVTECVTGLDLVALQVRVAEGERLAGLAVEEHGHAVEARLYAEDPARDWQPQSGRMSRFEIAADACFATPASYGVRVDAGYATGDEVGTHYDAMLAKVVAFAPTRDEALRRLAAALEWAQLHGVRTNRALLVEVLRHVAFVTGDLGTDFLVRHRLASTSPGAPDRAALQASAFAAAVAMAECARAGREVQRGVAPGWRNVVSAPRRTVFAHDGEVLAAEWYGGRDGYRSADGGLRARVETPGTSSEVVVMATAGDDAEVARRFEVHAEGDRLDVESPYGHVALTVVPRFVDPADQVASGSLLAPMPGTVVRLHVEPGQTVAAGGPVLVLEAMKMQHTVTAPHDGVVGEVPVQAGSQVAAGDVLAVVISTSSTTDRGDADE